MTARLDLYSTVIELIIFFAPIPLLCTQLNTVCPFARAWHLSKPILPPPEQASSKCTTSKRNGAKRPAAAPPSPADASMAASILLSLAAPHDEVVASANVGPAKEAEDIGGTPLVELMAIQDKQARVFLQQSRGVADLQNTLVLFERVRTAYKILQSALQALPHHLRGQRPIQIEEMDDKVSHLIYVTFS